MADDDFTLSLDDKPLRAQPGDSVASAMSRAGQLLLSRSVKYHRPRGAFCMQGSCGACLVRIDGRPNLRACRTAAAPGMKVERQNAFPSVALDVFGATDFFFPRGMDHHTLLTGAPKPMHAVMQKIARQLAGLGRLPDERPLEIPAARTQLVELVIVGAGPAGLAAATAAARAGKKVLLVEEQDRAGGSLLADPRHGPAVAAEHVASARAAGVEVLLRATALGWYAEDRAPGATTDGLLAVATPDGLLLVAAAQTIYATGSYDQNALFPDNDRPGIMSARAVGLLLVRDGIVPGKRIAVLGAGPYARALSDALAAAGATVTRIDGVTETIIAIDGQSRLRAVQFHTDRGDRRIRAEVLAVAALPAPATELAREHGCKVRWEASLGGFHVITDGAGRTSTRGVYAVGDVAGFLGPAAALEAGARVGAGLSP